MDAYNRGYNSSLGTAQGGLGGVGSTLGDAEIIKQTNSSDAQAVSFFAQAYTWKGNTVIPMGALTPAE
jgi:hypothetical protein